MLTCLGLGRAALLRASATGLLALLAALAVGIGAWLLADDLGSPVAPQLLFKTTAGIDRAAVEQLGSAEILDDLAPALVVTPLEIRPPAPFSEDDVASFFRIDEVRSLPESESAVAAATFWTSVPAAAEVTEAPEQVGGDRVRTTISFYYCEHDPESINPPGDGGGFCGAMRNGTVVYPGAAACDYDYLGQQFRILSDPLSRVYVCADTGSAVGGQHRDIWFQTSDEGWDWLWLTGAVATIEVLP